MTTINYYIWLAQSKVAEMSQMEMMAAFLVCLASLVIVVWLCWEMRMLKNRHNFLVHLYGKKRGSELFWFGHLPE